MLIVIFRFPRICLVVFQFPRNVLEHYRVSVGISFLSFSFFLYFWLWVFFAVKAFLQLQRKGATLQSWYAGFSLQWVLLCRALALGYIGFSSCSTWAQQMQLPGSRAGAKQLWHGGLVVARHVEPSWTRDRTRVSCFGRWILYH